MAMNPCSELPLERLLVDDHMNEALSSIAAHVDHCETCQARLTTLAADAHWWSDAREFLSGDWQPRWQPDLSLSATEPPDRSAGVWPVRSRWMILHVALYCWYRLTIFSRVLPTSMNRVQLRTISSSVSLGSMP